MAGPRKVVPLRPKGNDGSENQALNVPDQAPSGSGLLELAEATLDLRARFFHVSGSDAVKLLYELAHTPFGSTGVEHEHNVSLEVEVSYLEAGDALYLLGLIRRVEDPSAPASYRNMGTLPVITATDAHRLAVHAGTERSLLRGLALERTYLAMVMGAGATLAASLVAALAWLATRA